MVTVTKNEVVTVESTYMLELLEHEAVVLWLTLGRVMGDRSQRTPCAHVDSIAEALQPHVSQQALLFSESCYFNTKGSITINQTLPLESEPSAGATLEVVLTKDKDEPVTYHRVIQLTVSEETALVLSVILGQIYGPGDEFTPRDITAELFTRLGQRLGWDARDHWMAKHIDVNSTLWLYPNK